MPEKSSCWDRQIQEEHQVLNSQREAIGATLERRAGPSDPRVDLWKILRGFSPRLELHLRQEEEVLFPALERLVGKGSGPLSLLMDQHEQLRAHIQRLSELLDCLKGCPWETIAQTGQSLVHLLENHEVKEGRFLLDLLECSLKPDELMGLARQFQQAAGRVFCEEEL